MWLCGFISLCVCWYVAFLHCLCFWFYIICDISIRLCVCVLDMPIILKSPVMCVTNSCEIKLNKLLYAKNKRGTPLILHGSLSKHFQYIWSSPPLGIFIVQSTSEVSPKRHKFTKPPFGKVMQSLFRNE